MRIPAAVALSVLLGWLIVHGLNWEELGILLYRMPLGLALMALGVFLAGIVLRAWRWYLLFVNERVSFIRLFLVQNAGIGLNNLSPVRVLSEPVQLLLLTRRGRISGGTALGTLATEHIFDIFVTSGLLVTGVLLMPELRGFTIQLGAAVVLATVSLVVFILLVKGMDAIPGLRRVSFLQGAIESIKSLRHAPLRLFLAFLGTLGHWSSLGLSGWIIAQGLGIEEVDVAVVVVLFMGSVFFVTAIPSLPGGAVTFEAAVVYSLGLFGVKDEPALAFALIMHVIMFAPSTLIALIVLPREGVQVFGRKKPVMVEGGGDSR